MDFFWIFDAFYKIIYHPSDSRFAICATYGYNKSALREIATAKIEFTHDFSCRVNLMSAGDSWCWYDYIVALIA